MRQRWQDLLDWWHDDARTARRRRGVMLLCCALATALCLGAWGRLGYVAVAHPSPWQSVVWRLPDGSTGQGEVGILCWWNAFQQGDVVYRWPCADREGEGRHYVVAFDLRARTATVRWELPSSGIPADRFAAVAPGPGDDLTVLPERESRVYRLRADGQVEDLGPFPDATVSRIVGMAWVGTRLELLVLSGDTVNLIGYEPGQGWGAPRALPAPDSCTVEHSCALLTATPTGPGWRLLYGRAPRRPPDPQQVVAELFLADVDGRVQQTDTLALQPRQQRPSVGPRRAGQYTVADDGTLRWDWNSVDRTPGNVLNAGGYGTTLRLRPDGILQAIPPLSPELLASRTRPDRSGPAPDLAEGAPLCTSYQLDDDRLRWLPLFTRGLLTGGNRVLLLDDRWVVLRQTDGGLRLEERETDDRATLRRRGPMVLGGAAEAMSWDCVLAPLLPATDGGYWLLDGYGHHLRIGADLARADSLPLRERVRLLFAGFGEYRDDFHREHPLRKQVGIVFLLGGWPLLTGALLLWRRGGQPYPEDWRAWVFRSAFLCLVLGGLIWRWFWTATTFF